jgi:maltose alpha-D-glucosyltransferase/alpha-amylase
VAHRLSVETVRAAGATDADWYKDAVIYELHVRTFFDSNDDGVGDFRGLTQKLGYLHDLGITAVWLLPFYPSPLRDDGYDIADYVNVHPQYGTLRDFQVFLREAHRLGIKVITELVLNHTSDQHPWFERARRAKPGSYWRKFYVWSDTPDRYGDARILFPDFERSNWTWDPVAQAYYWHRFYAHQPDLNYDHPPVQRAILKAVDFWLGMGVDGLRLDAVPYLYEREGTTCENLPETHAFLKRLRAHIDARFPHRMLLAEANQWPEDAVAYFGAGDECHMAFHFPLMPRMFLALYLEDRYPILDILEQTPPIPASCQWALFLRNHDELTLEMVTEQERDFMYQVYGTDPRSRINLGIRRRLAPLLNNNRRRIELLHGILFALPGTPVIYYGNEIGMGDNIYLGDRDGVRTPFQWSAERNAGFSRANPQKLCLPVVTDPEYHYQAVNVEAQQNNPHSLWWWMKRLIALRKRVRAFGRGDLELLHPDNPRILAFIRRYGEEIILVVANLSRFAQAAELDLRRYVGRVPVELFGRTPFPPVGERPYFLTLGPHSFYYFALEADRAPVEIREGEATVPAVTVEADWRELFQVVERRAGLEDALGRYVANARWFGGRTRRRTASHLEVVVPVTPRHALALVRVTYAGGGEETYQVPLVFRPEGEPPGGGVVLRVRGPAGAAGVVADAAEDPEWARLVLEALGRRRRWRNGEGMVVPVPTAAFRTYRTMGDWSVTPLGRDHTHTAWLYGDRALWKLYRRVEPGANPEWEMGAFLTAHGFERTPAVLGTLEYRSEAAGPVILGVLQAYVPNEGDAWQFTRDHLRRFLEHALARHPGGPPEGRWAEAAEQALAPYLAAVRLLGRRTAELHRCLASEATDPAFAPEPFTPFYLRDLYQSMRALATRTLDALRRRLGDLGEVERAVAEDVLAHQGAILETFRRTFSGPMAGCRIRLHGDLHLGQVLYTGKDFVFIDFEGEPRRRLSERRIKGSPLRDVAAMVRSFHYAAEAEWERAPDVGDPAAVRRWLDAWFAEVATAFVTGYRDAVGEGELVPAGGGFEPLLKVYMLEKSLYELQYEMEHRPGWIGVPLRGVQSLLPGPRPDDRR